MIIDSHCHLDFDAFNDDRESVIKNANAQGVTKIIIPGVMRNTWSNIKQCCETYSGLYPCYGLHPYFINDHKKSDLDKLKNWIDSNNPVAVGECGLDYFLKNLDKELQTFYFEQQLDLAIDSQLPVVIHARKSTEDVINAIKKRPDLKGMIHSYSGSYEQAVKLVDLGFYLSFGGPITYKKSTRLRKTVQSLPLDNLLVETDAPDQPTANATSQRNEPAFISEVIDTIAELHELDREIIASVTTENAQKLFQLI